MHDRRRYSRLGRPTDGCQEENGEHGEVEEDIEPGGRRADFDPCREERVGGAAVAPDAVRGAVEKEGEDAAEVV